MKTLTLTFKGLDDWDYPVYLVTKFRKSYRGLSLTTQLLELIGRLPNQSREHRQFVTAVIVSYHTKVSLATVVFSIRSVLRMVTVQQKHVRKLLRFIYFDRIISCRLLSVFLLQASTFSRGI